MISALGLFDRRRVRSTQQKHMRIRNAQDWLRRSIRLEMATNWPLLITPLVAIRGDLDTKMVAHAGFEPAISALRVHSEPSQTLPDDPL